MPVRIKNTSVLSIILLLLILCGCEEGVIKIDSSGATAELSKFSEVRFDGIASIDSVTDTAATINWTHVLGASKYEIFLVNSSAITSVGSVDAPISNYNLVSQQPGTTQTYRVKLIDSNGKYDMNIKDLSVTYSAIDIPTISTVADLSIDIDEATGPISVVINDLFSTLTCSSSLSALSSNTSLVDTAEISIGGVAPNCTVSLTPKRDQSGSTTISLTVSDGVLTSSETFLLSVYSPRETIGLTAWFDASDTSTVFTDTGCTNAAVIGDTVQCWVDRSSYSHSAVEAFGPLYSGNILNGLPGLSFSGSGEFLTVSTIANTVRSIFILYSDSSTESWACPISGVENYHAHADNNQLVNATWGNDDYRNGSWYENKSPIDPFTTSRPGNTHKLYSIITNAAIPSFETIGRDRIYPVRGIVGDILEIVIYDNVLSASDRAKVEDYLFRKWNL